MATAHFFSVKVPILFVYWDTPFYAYQDKIISFAVIAYVALFSTAARVREAVMPAIVTIWMTVLGLCTVNMSDALRTLPGHLSLNAYWTEIDMIAVIAFWLTFLYVKEKKQHNG
jgi:hypothetical protein